MINFENISKFYNGDPALDSINLSVSAGEFISIVGQSGAGKTTLIKLILAEEKPTSGSVFFAREIDSIACVPSKARATSSLLTAHLKFWPNCFLCDLTFSRMLKNSCISRRSNQPITPF